MVGAIAKPSMRSPPKLSRAAGRHSRSWLTWPTPPPSKGLVAAAVARFGRLDILINNAAVRPEKALETMTLADWHGVLGVILDGAFLTARAAHPFAGERRRRHCQYRWC